MKRGTRVGQAYVAMTVDGDDINKEITDAFEDVDYDKIGRDSSGRFVKHWGEIREQIAEHIMGVDSDLRDSIERMGSAFRNDDAITQGVRHQLAKAFDEGSLDSIMDRVGDTLGVRVGDEMRRTMTASILDSLEDVLQDSARSGGGPHLVASRGDTAIDLPTDTFDRITEAAEKAVKERTKLHEKEAADYLRDWDAAIKERVRLEARAQKRIELISKARSKFEDDLAKGRVDDRGVDLDRRRRSLGDTVGRVFGAGSRNNFLNFFGRTLGNIVNLTEKVRTGSVSMFKTFSEGFSNAAEGAGFFTKVMGGLRAVGGGGGFLAGLAGAAPAIAVVTIALSALVSVMGALLGIATALASVIVAGLIGGLTVLAGAIGTAAVAGGLLTAAFMSMTDAQKEILKVSFKPLHEEMIGIGQLMLTQMIPYFDEWSKNLQEALLLAAPLASVMGEAFGKAGEALTAFLSGPGFQQLSTALAVYLPNIVTMLGVAIGGFLDGMAGTFAAILPFVNQFAIYLGDLAVRFSNWASSAEGQNAIVDFVYKATEALKSLWNFTREFFGFLGDVLFSDQAIGAGITIFDAMATKFGEFRDAVSEAAANGDLERWFNDAIEFGGQLWSLMEALGGTFMALYNSGVLEGVGNGLALVGGVIEAVNFFLGPLIDAIGQGLPDALGNLASNSGGAIGALLSIAAAAEKAYNWVANLKFIREGKAALDVVNGMDDRSSVRDNTPNSSDFMQRIQKFMNDLKKNRPEGFSLGSLIGSGRNALSKTTPKSEADKFVNPYKEMADRIIKEAPTLAQKLRAALYMVNKEIVNAIRETAFSADITSVKSTITTLTTNLIADAKQAVDSAQNAVNSAAQSLKNASSDDAAENALDKLRQAQDDLKAATKNQETILQGVRRINAQKYSTRSNVVALVKGLRAQNATIADYTLARGYITRKLEEANTKLADAIAMRDQYRDQVTNAAKEFGSLITTQGQVLGGIEQALTVTDITTNLQTRLDKIRKFQEDLRQLSSQGLNQAAYKQIVDAGVEDGSRFTEALLAGGTQAVAQVNSLVTQIDGISNSLGYETANRMYQAGVDAAQGLVDGLTSLSSKLDAAASRLGNSIAKSIRRSLGIKSPSTVLMNDMNYAGDGLVKGLNNQTNKVSSAAESLARQISITPRTGVVGGDGASAGVSGNSGDPRFRDLIIQTPTEDPHAVAMEALNEITGRL